jgi:hypothetical protein
MVTGFERSAEKLEFEEHSRPQSCLSVSRVQLYCVEGQNFLRLPLEEGQTLS